MFKFQQQNCSEMLYIYHPLFIHLEINLINHSIRWYNFALNEHLGLKFGSSSSLPCSIHHQEKRLIKLNLNGNFFIYENFIVFSLFYLLTKINISLQNSISYQLGTLLPHYVLHYIRLFELIISFFNVF